MAREGEPPGEPAPGGGSAGASPSRIPVPNSAGWYLEIEPIDILLGEQERLPEQDVVALDLDRAEPAGLELGVTAFQSAFLERAGGVNRQVAEVHRVPQDDA